MFARRLLSRIPTVARRSMSEAATAGKKVYREKTFKEVWLGDAGAYPVMGIIVFITCMSTSFSIYSFTHTPDARFFNKTERKKFLRGDISDEAQRHRDGLDFLERPQSRQSVATEDFGDDIVIVE